MQKHSWFISVATALCLVFLITGCASRSSVTGFKPVYVTNFKTVQILPEDCYSGDELNAMYQLQVSAEGQSFSLIAMMYADDMGLELTLLNDFGTEMGYLYYGDGFVELDCSLLPDMMYAEFLVHDIQLALYDFAALTANYAGKGLSITSEETCLEEVRTLKNGKKVIETARISQDRTEITIENHYRGYSFSLTGGIPADF